MSTRPNTRSGFSMVELMVAMLILAALLGAVGLTIIQGSGAYQQGVAANVVESQARRGLDRIASAFIAAKLDPATFIPIAQSPLFTDSIQFEQGIGVVGGALQTRSMRIEVQLDPGEVADGLDNDGDGVADEGRVVLRENFLQPNEVNRVLCTNVRRFLEGETLNGADDNGNGFTDEGGLTFDVQGRTLNIRLSLERLDQDGNSIVRTIETTVLLRN